MVIAASTVLDQTLCELMHDCPYYVCFQPYSSTYLRPSRFSWPASTAWQSSGSSYAFPSLSHSNPGNALPLDLTLVSSLEEREPPPFPPYHRLLAPHLVCQPAASSLF